MGSSSAQLQLAHNYWRGEYGEPSLEHAIAWATRSAARRNTAALVFLGNLFAQRSGPGDPERAAQAYDRAASLGSLDGMYSLGICYEHGEGVPQSLGKAAELYAAAAAGGHEPAASARLALFAKQQGLRTDNQQVHRPAADQLALPAARTPSEKT